MGPVSGAGSELGRNVASRASPWRTRSLGLSPDGMTLAAGNVDGTVSLWDTATGKNRVNLRAGTEMILAAVFSPDGTRLACSSTDSRIHIWDLATHRLPLTLEGNRAPSPRWRFLQADGSWHPAERIRPCGSGTWKT